MGQAYRIDELEAVYDKLCNTNPQAAATLGVVIDRIQDELGLSPDHSKTISLYIG